MGGDVLKKTELTLKCSTYACSKNVKTPIVNFYNFKYKSWRFKKNISFHPSHHSNLGQYIPWTEKKFLNGPLE